MYIYILALFLSAFSLTLASDEANSSAVEEALNSVEEVEAAPYPIERLEEKWTPKLERKNKYLGMLNDDGSIYVIGSAVAVKNPGDRGFTESI